MDLTVIGASRQVQEYWSAPANFVNFSSKVMRGGVGVSANLPDRSPAGRENCCLINIAERQEISLSYLEQLFAMLRRSALVVSSRGPGGGYRLGRNAEEISIGEVFRAVEETANGSEGGRDWTAGGGATASLWTALDDHIREFLEGVSVADVMAGRLNGVVANGSAHRADGGLSAPGKLA